MNVGPGFQVPASQANYVKKGNISSRNRMRKEIQGLHTTKTTGAIDSSAYTGLIANASATKRQNALNIVGGPPTNLQDPYRGCACLELAGINNPGRTLVNQHIYGEV